MNWRRLIIPLLVISLSGARIAMADGNHQHQKASGTGSSGTEENHDMDGMNMGDGHDMDGMDMGDGHDMDSMKGNGEQSGHDMKSMKGNSEHSGHDMKSMKGDNQHDGNDMEGMTEGDNMEGMDMGGSHSHGPVKETPPNVKVLGTFGAVNLSFIVIGVWHKLFRRKGGSDGTSK